MAETCQPLPNLDGGFAYGESSLSTASFEEITLSAWIKADNLPIGGSAILSAVDGPSLSPIPLGWDFSRNSTHFKFWADRSNLSAFVSVPFSDTTSWHNIVATYDGNYQKIYLDGVLEDTLSYSVGLDGSGSTYIGAHSSNIYFPCNKCTIKVVRPRVIRASQHIF